MALFLCTCVYLILERYQFPGIFPIAQGIVFCNNSKLSNNIQQLADNLAINRQVCLVKYTRSSLPPLFFGHVIKERVAIGSLII